MRDRTTVSELMTGPPLTVGVGTWFKELARLMIEADSRCVLISSRRGNLVGIVTDADLLVKACRREVEGRPAAHEPRNRRAERRRASAVRAQDLMSTPVITVRPTASALDAAELMLRHRVRHLVVTGPRREPLGIVSRRDLLPTVIREDGKVEADLHDLAERDLRARAGRVEISVDDGLVTVTDSLHDRRAMSAFLRDAATVEGATAVRHIERPATRADDPGANTP